MNRVGSEAHNLTGHDGDVKSGIGFNSRRHQKAAGYNGREWTVMAVTQIQAAVRVMIDEHLRGRGIRDRHVLDVMSTVPRHQFVPDVDPATAYTDRALPTVEGQTISQPYMVALMTEMLEVDMGMKVLEIGTGSGYQTAILLALGATVVTIERSESLARRAQGILEELALSDNRLTILVGDGTRGCPNHAPYDRILVTAGASHLPQAYREQLADAGRIVIPIGDRHGQYLMLLERHGQQFRHSRAIACRFVPLIGLDGWCEGD